VLQQTLVLIVGNANPRPGVEGARMRSAGLLSASH